jgi:hypothetical protein
MMSLLNKYNFPIYLIAVILFVLYLFGTLTLLSNTSNHVINVAYSSLLYINKANYDSVSPFQETLLDGTVLTVSVKDNNGKQKIVSIRAEQKVPTFLGLSLKETCQDTQMVILNKPE